MKKITFIILCFLTINFASAQLTSVAIVGDGAGGWPGETGNPGPVDTHQLASTDGIIWTINNLTLTSGSAKFRGNNSWDLPYNWGGNSFPSGTGIVDGGGMTTVAGVYNVSFNSSTLTYNFTLVTGSGLTSISIVGDGAGGWPGDAGNPGPVDAIQMGTTDGENWTINNLTLTVGSVKFRGNNSWDLPYNWGGASFPSGTGTVDGSAITSASGVYNVSFNSTTFVYDFVLVNSGLTSIAIVGDGAGGWPGDAGNPGPVDSNQMSTTDGVNWTIENLTLTSGSAKFRGNNSWDLPYNWGATTFPTGTGIVDGAGITTSAGTYNVTFNSDTFAYSFSTTLSVDAYNASNFMIYPNPTKDIINIKSNKVISSLMLFDLTGKKVFDTQQVINNQVFIGELLSGIYLMRTKDSEENSVVKKIVVE
jgi:hypothetical protein